MAAPPPRRRRQAAAATGITIEPFRPLGCTAPAGSTDDGRFRRLTVHLPAEYAQALFNARDQGATEDQLRAIVAQGLQEVYFKDGGSRAGNLEA
ncbi:XRE family transcriptional regulator OS=Streptomyces rutgersensis OX=53451 GN=F0345_28465 PE=4 SV=1 [Streptomyces diastaticus subsp. diastaticus]